ncbi:hypothetical protein OG716_21875 [Nocardia sp. NBC_01388]
MSSHRLPAVDRLRRARWLMTGLVTAITATAVLALGFVASTIDSHSRAIEADRQVEKVAGGLARAIQHDDKNVLDLSTVIDDDLAKGPTAVVVLVRKQGESWKQEHTYLRSLMPSDTEITTLATQTEDHSNGDLYASMLNTATDITGRKVRVAGTPVYWTDWDNFVVILASSESMDNPGQHRMLLWALTIGGSLLVLLSTAAAYLLSGRSLRQALRLLDEHEQFLGDAAHELRTPLTTLKLLTESRPKPEEVQQTLAEARKLADRMARLVTGLLARARMQTGIAELERTLLRLDQLAEAVAEEAADDRITVTAHPYRRGGRPPAPRPRHPEHAGERPDPRRRKPFRPRGSPYRRGPGQRPRPRPRRRPGHVRQPLRPRDRRPLRPQWHRPRPRRLGGPGPRRQCLHRTRRGRRHDRHPLAPSRRHHRRRPGRSAYLIPPDR